MNKKKSNRRRSFLITLILAGILTCISAFRLIPAHARIDSLAQAELNSLWLRNAKQESTVRSRFSTLYDRFGQNPIKITDPLMPQSPQTPGTSFLAVTHAESGFTTPDPALAVGPSQILVAVNGRIRTFSRTGVLDGVIDATTDNFFNAVRNGVRTTEPRATFDRLSQRFFVTMVTQPQPNITPNRILIAVSVGPTITSQASFSLFQFQPDLVGQVPNADTGGVALDDTLGVDANAVNIGANIYNSSQTSITGSTAFVVNKSALLAASPSLNVTPFRQVFAFDPVGVDNDDLNAMQSFFVGTDRNSQNLIDLLRISNPGTLPSLSNSNLVVPQMAQPAKVPAQGSNLPLDGDDDRLRSAMIKNGSLFTSQTIQVNGNGNPSATGGRDGIRLFQLGNLTGQPTIIQSGTLFDSAASNPVFFWNGSVAASGQGHVALGSSFAAAAPFNGGSINGFAGAAFSGRLAGDPLGALNQTTFFPGAAAYNFETSSPQASQHWGDYSSVTVDPNDNMTMWTAQEICNVQNTWGILVTQLKAPLPATPASASPASANQGVTTNVNVTGTSSNGSGFYDPGSGFPNHISATVNGGGATVNSVTFTNSTTITLNLTIANDATPGARAITVTNPDGQLMTSSTGIFNIINSIPTISSFSPASGPVGTSVVITGSNFTGATSVGFNAVNANSFTVNSNTQITTTVPTGATSGPVTVTTPVGTATSAPNFTVNTAVADLRVSANVPQFVSPGDNPVFNFTITNNGPSPATNATITIQIPTGLPNVSATATQGSCVSGSSITCNLGDLPASSINIISVVSGNLSPSATDDLIISNFRLGQVFTQEAGTTFSAGPAIAFPNGYSPTVLNLLTSAALATNFDGNGGQNDIAVIDQEKGFVFTLLNSGLSIPSNIGILVLDIFTDTARPTSATSFVDAKTGLNDLAITDIATPSNNSGSGQVVVGINDGRGNFSDISQFRGFVTVSSPTDINHGDFNNDGADDLVAIDLNSNLALTMLNDGSNLFVTQHTRETGGFQPVAAVMGDFNDDNNLDIVTLNRGSATNPNQGVVTLMLGDGTGRLAPANALVSVDNFGVSIVGGLVDLNGVGIRQKMDLNNDGLADLAVLAAGGAGSAIIPLLNDSTHPGRFVTGQPIPLKNGAGTTFQTPLAVFDVNKDGKPDLIAGNGDGTVSVFLNTTPAGSASPTFNRSEVRCGSFGPSSLAIRDFDGDGFPDIFVSGCGGLLSFTATASSSVADPNSLNNTLKTATFVNSPPATVSSISSSGSSSPEQTVLNSSPVINATTSSGSPGQLVTITGDNFFGAGVTFNGVPGKIISNTLTKIVAVIPPGATSGPIAVVTPAGSVATPTSFNVISSFVQLSSTSYSVSEGAGFATINVPRAGDTSAPASVNFATTDGTAKQQRDYTFASGTLSFAPGETSKTFTVLVTDNASVDGSRTVNLALSNTVGTGFGSPTVGTLTITDNDTSPGTTNPIDQARFFVQQHYYDFLSRYPDQGGWDFWTNNIDNCTPKPACTDAQRINTSAAYFLSIEFQQTGYLVERIYKTAYGNASGRSTFGGTHQFPVPVVRFNEFMADTQRIGNGLVVGQTGWEQVLENNKQAFTLTFVQRSRFTAAFATTLTPAQFVDALFANAGVTPSTTDRNAAIAEFGSATNTTDVAARARALRDVAENSLLNTAEFNRAFVLMQFFGYLRRNPNDLPDADYTGFDFWLTKLNQFNGNYVAAEMVKAFIVSTEYRQRFGP